MADQVIQFEGQEHHFPADFTDQDIAKALASTHAAATPIPYATKQSAQIGRLAPPGSAQRKAQNAAIATLPPEQQGGRFSGPVASTLAEYGGGKDLVQGARTFTEPGFDSKFQGIHEMGVGAGKALLPLAAPWMIANPLTALVTGAAGGAGQMLGSGLAGAVGAPPGVSNVVGDIAGIGTGMAAQRAIPFIRAFAASPDLREKTLNVIPGNPGTKLREVGETYRGIIDAAREAMKPPPEWASETRAAVENQARAPEPQHSGGWISSGPVEAGRAIPPPPPGAAPAPPPSPSGVPEGVDPQWFRAMSPDAQQQLRTKLGQATPSPVNTSALPVKPLTPPPGAETPRTWPDRMSEGDARKLHSEVVYNNAVRKNATMAQKFMDQGLTPEQVQKMPDAELLAHLKAAGFDTPRKAAGTPTSSQRTLEQVRADIVRTMPFGPPPK